MTGCLWDLDKVLEQPDYADAFLWKTGSSWTSPYGVLLARGLECDGGKGEDRSDDGAVKC